MKVHRLTIIRATPGHGGDEIIDENFTTKTLAKRTAKAFAKAIERREIGLYANSLQFAPEVPKVMNDHFVIPVVKPTGNGPAKIVVLYYRVEIQPAEIREKALSKNELRGIIGLA